MRNDTNGSGNLQWFYFRMKNSSDFLETIRINIVNFTKGNSLFHHVSGRTDWLTVHVALVSPNNLIDESLCAGNETIDMVNQNEQKSGRGRRRLGLELLWECYVRGFSIPEGDQWPESLKVAFLLDNELWLYIHVSKWWGVRCLHCALLIYPDVAALKALEDTFWWVT